MTGNPGGAEQIFIDGAWVPSGSPTLREIRNPASGDLLGRVPDCGREDVDRAVRSARSAQRSWERTPAVEKAVLLHKVAHDIRLPTTEEIFGPVISLTIVEDAEEAILKANDSRYGLGACVYTRSLELALRAMEGIKAGTFWVNDPLTDNDAAPFGGARSSGIGRELGEEGLDAFREPKHVHIDWVIEPKSFWFPYRDREVK